MTSLGNISVDYNEGSAVAKRNTINQKSNFMRKSQSISAIQPFSSKKKTSKANLDDLPQADQILNRHNSNDLNDVVFDAERPIDATDLISKRKMSDDYSTEQ